MSPLSQLIDNPIEALMDEWFEAEFDAIAAYDRWAEDGDPGSYAVYLAYADQADAAQDELAAASRGRLT